MTTNYAQQLHLTARADVRQSGRIRSVTATALENIGYDQSAIAGLERRLLDERDEPARA